MSGPGRRVSLLSGETIVVSGLGLASRVEDLRRELVTQRPPAAGATYRLLAAGTTRVLDGPEVLAGEDFLAVVEHLTEEDRRLLCEAEASAAALRQRRVVRQLRRHCFQAVCQQAATLQSEPMLVEAACGGNVSEAVLCLGATASAASVVGLAVNQVGGRLSGAYGRKPLFMLGPLVNVVSCFLIFSFSSCKPLVVACRMLRKVFAIFSGTLMPMAALCDVFDSGPRAHATASLGATIGLATLVGPSIEVAILSRTGNDFRRPYLAVVVLGLVQLCLAASMDETLEAANRVRLSAAGVFAGFNPFDFMRIFTCDNARLKKLMVIVAFQQIAEGRNLSDVGQIFMRDRLKWSPPQVRNYFVTWACAVLLQGVLVVPSLLRRLGVRGFSTCANLALFLGLGLQGATEKGIFYKLGAVIALPGINGASATGLRGPCLALAVDAGFTTAEFTAMFNNLRSVVSAISTALFGITYARCQQSGLPPGAGAYWLAALLGAAVPQILLQQVDV